MGALEPQGPHLPSISGSYSTPLRHPPSLLLTVDKIERTCFLLSSLSLVFNIGFSLYLIEVCGYTRTRGFTRTRPVPAGWVRIGEAFHRAGRGRGEGAPGRGGPGYSH